MVKNVLQGVSHVKFKDPINPESGSDLDGVPGPPQVCTEYQRNLIRFEGPMILVHFWCACRPLSSPSLLSLSVNVLAGELIKILYIMS